MSENKILTENILILTERDCLHPAANCKSPTSARGEIILCHCHTSLLQVISLHAGIVLSTNYLAEQRKGVRNAQQIAMDRVQQMYQIYYLFRRQ
jgi:hypothetical protein